MRFIPFKIILTAALLSPLSLMAQGDTGESADTNFNPTMMVLVTFILVLAAANAMLAYVLKGIVDAYMEKRRKERLELRNKQSKEGLTKVIAMIMLLLLPAIQVFAQASEEVVVVASPFISGIPRGDFYFLTMIIAFLLLIMLAQIFIIKGMLRTLRGIPMKEYVRPAIFRKNFLDVFNKSVAVDKEETITLDHDYDGIRELDNDLPPWWKWGFILTIIASFLYVGYYHAWGGPNQIDEYNASVAKAEEAKLSYLAKAGDQVDENNVVMVMDPASLADAQALYNNVCAACHKPDGGGSVGPNLTDDYWLHGGSIKDVFKSIKYGYRDKGMPPWNGNLSAKQIANISSYVKSMRGSNPPGAKPAQGDLFVEGGDNAIDSVSNKTEPSLTPTGTTENKNNTIGPYDNKADGQGKGTPPGK